jgi:hypothetical protein
MKLSNTINKLEWLSLVNKAIAYLVEPFKDKLQASSGCEGLQLTNTLAY